MYWIFVSFLLSMQYANRCRYELLIAWHVLDQITVEVIRNLYCILFAIYSDRLGKGGRLWGDHSGRLEECGRSPVGVGGVRVGVSCGTVGECGPRQKG